MVNYDSGGFESSEWVKLPKVGEPPIELCIKSGEKVNDPEYKYNFMRNEPVMLNGEHVIDDSGEPVYKKVNQGFRYIFTCEDGKKFSLSSWKPYFAFKDANVQDGDKILVKHPEKGVWEVEVLLRGKEVAEAWNE